MKDLQNETVKYKTMFDKAKGGASSMDSLTPHASQAVANAGGAKV